MKIQSSQVSMASSHQFNAHTESKMATITTNSAAKADAIAATITLSEDAGSYVDKLNKYIEDQKKQQKEQQKENEKKMAQEFLNQANEAKKVNDGFEMKEIKDPKIEMLKRMLEIMKAFQEGKRITPAQLAKLSAPIEMPTSQNTTQPFSPMTATGITNNSVGSEIKPLNPAGNFSTLKRITVQSSFYYESEVTAFQGTGIAKTADGREINFGVTFEMSRAFCDTYNSFSEQNIVYCDPLVINLNTTAASVSDQKFYFDLDADGKEDKISELNNGSGFLAIDKNKDGKINDGSELFGAKSGDGFKDLAEYDEDHNGWIDENDSIFKDLVVWTKDENGDNQLIDLKSADVGAIYLGKASTQFSLNSTTNSHTTNAMIRSTGMYLKESGGVGTVQHIDMAL